MGQRFVLVIELILILQVLFPAALVRAQEEAPMSGSWELLVENAGISSMHTAVTRFGTVILLDRTNIGASQIDLSDGRCRNNPEDQRLQTDCTAHSIEFNPGANKIRPLFIFTDTWCSSGQFQADGTLIQTGGDNDGIRKVRYFAPCADESCDWVESEGDVLQNGRWYASNALLPDNRQIIVGGRSMTTIEYLPNTGEDTTAIYSAFLEQTRDYQNDNMYPYVHLLPDDTIFIFANRDSIIYDYKTNTVLKTLPTIPGEPRNYPSAGSSVMLPLVASDGFKEVQILVCGGAMKGAYSNPDAQYPASQTCGRITLSNENPQWIMETMPFRRTMGDMLILPNRDVLIINGAENGSQGWGGASNPVYNPVLYRPGMNPSERFVTLAASNIPRLYHSSANLLPDGRILVAGSNTHQFYTFTGEFPTELRIEAFSPPYLNAALNFMRPVFQTWPRSIAYGETFQVVVDIQAPVTENRHVEFNLISAPFTTHSYSMGLRALRLNLSNVENLGNHKWQYTITAPPSTIIAPSSYYMLFAVYSKIPSEAVWVHIG